MSISNVAVQSRSQVNIRKITNKLDPTSVTVPTTGWFAIVAESIGLRETKQTLSSNSFDASLMLPELKGGNIAVEGQIGMNLLKEGQEWIYPLALGGSYTHSAVDTVTGLTTHTLYPDADVHLGYFLVERQIQSQSTSGYKVFANCWIDSISISSPQDGIATVNVNVFSEFAIDPNNVTSPVINPSQSSDFPNVSISTDPTLPVLDDDYYVGHRGQLRLRPRDNTDTFSAVEYTPDYVKGFSLEIGVNLIKDGYTLRENRDASVYVSQVGKNRRSVTGSIDVVFTADDNIEQAFKTLNAMQLIFELEENGYITRFIIPRAKITDSYDPSLAQGDGFVSMSIPFTATKFDDSAGSTGEIYDIAVEIVDSLPEANFANWEDVTFS